MLLCNESLTGDWMILTKIIVIHNVSYFWRLSNKATIHTRARCGRRER